MKETAYTRLKEALKNCREKSLDWESAIGYMAFVIENEFVDVPTGEYIKVLKEICKVKDAKCLLLGFHPVNLAVALYVDYGRPKHLYIAKVCRVYKRDRTMILNVRRRIKQAIRISRKK